MTEDKWTVSSGMYWGSWIVSILPCLLLLMSGFMKFIQPAGFEEGLRQMGWESNKMYYLGVVEIVCTALYLLPRTAVLGAILLTGYLGGAIATHARIGDIFIIQALLGITLWAGLYMRDLRIRRLIPLN